MIQDPIAQNAFDTRCTTLLKAFLIPQAYLQSLNSRTLSLFTTAARNLHQWSECPAMFLAKTMCGRTQLTMPRADPEEGAGVWTPAPWKITNSIGYIEICNWTPPHGKSWTPWKCWTVLLHAISESYSLMIVFF